MQSIIRMVEQEIELERNVNCEYRYKVRNLSCSTKFKKEKMETRKVRPFGMLYSQGKEYFLINPMGVERDWEGECAYRFAVVPRREQFFAGSEVYPHARHIVVTDPFIIEYSPAMPEIKVKQLDEYGE